MKRIQGSSAFTLIELLIVVAIIAILAAIAVPNFLESQTRAKVSRVKADMRSVQTGLEAYAADHNHYPPNLLDGVGRTNVMNMPMGKMPFVPYTITTPISYITSVPLDTFKPKVMIDHVHSFLYFNSTNTPDDLNRRAHRARVNSFPMGEEYNVGVPEWSLTSIGPDRQFGTMATQVDLDGDLPIYEIMTMPMMGMGNMGSMAQYDPTNGTISDGDITIFGP